MYTLFYLRCFPLGEIDTSMLSVRLFVEKSCSLFYSRMKSFIGSNLRI